MPVPPKSVKDPDDYPTFDGLEAAAEFVSSVSVPVTARALKSAVARGDLRQYKLANRRCFTKNDLLAFILASDV